MLNYLLETASFLPHGFCLLWRPDLVALHVVSDLTVGFAYFSIPLAILAFLRRRPDFEYRWVAYLFARILKGSNRVSGWWAAERPRGRRAGLFLGIWRYGRTRRGRDSRVASPGRCPGAAAARSAAATRCLPWS